MIELREYQLAHWIGRLLIGDAPAEFRYHGGVFTVTRYPTKYIIETARTVREVRAVRRMDRTITQVVETIKKLAIAQEDAA